MEENGVKIKKMREITWEEREKEREKREKGRGNRFYFYLLLFSIFN